MGNNISRNQEQEKIMSCIYSALVNTLSEDEFSLESLMEGVFGISFEDIPAFSKRIVVKSLTHFDEIKDIYQAKMPTWKFDRLNAVTKSILLMSYTHFKLEGDVEKAIVINTAVVLAKKFLDKDDYKFVNGILDKVLC